MQQVQKKSTYFVTFVALVEKRRTFCTKSHYKKCTFLDDFIKRNEKAKS